MTATAPPGTSTPRAAMMTVDALLDAVVDADRVIAMAYAMKAQLLDTARRVHEEWRGRGSSIAAREFEMETALALRIPERTAGSLVEESRILVEELPRTLDALAEGTLTPRHARVLVEETRDVDDDARADLETRGLRDADRSTGEFARRLRRYRARRSPETAVLRRRKAELTRDVRLAPGRDGMGWLTAHLPAVELEAIGDRLDSLARSMSTSGDPRTFDQLRADALCDTLLGRDSETARRFEGLRPTVVVTIPALTLLGRSHEPAELEGYGPIDEETARELTAEAPELRRMLTDPHSGIALSLGRERYRPTADLRLWLRLRDRTCRTPGCPCPARAADIDHRLPWAKDGSTDDSNLAHFCRRHHTMKEESAFSVRREPDDTLIWRSPLGREYPHPPPGSEDERHGRERAVRPGQRTVTSNRCTFTP